MENLVVTLETAKALKAAGFPQKTAETWFNEERSEGSVIDGSYNEWTEWTLWDSYVLDKTGFYEVEDTDFFAAPTAQELADQLPRRIESHPLPNSLVLSQQQPGWFASYDCMDNESIEASYADTMAEALAGLWIKLNGSDQAKR
jgi:hypothetical protein